MKAIKFAAAALSVLLAVGLGLSSLFTFPVPEGVIPATEFSALRAAEDIKVIAKDVHTNDSAAIIEVRNYLKSTLESIGLEVELRTYEKDYEKPGKNYGTHVTAVDICGTLKGERNRSILLVAHYDSNPGKGVGEAPGSHGASDDAYGVSVILETLRCLKARGNMKNTVRVVFTDAEETSMLGSSAISADEIYNAAASDAVFNIESRGLSGPAILFETSANNAALIRFYAANAKYPATWSLATDVYRIMPNYTDFTAFLDAGMQGLNFSNLYRIEDNHRPSDLYENINLSSLQAYGEQILPVVAAFVSENGPATFDSDADMSWFTIMRGVMVRYPASLNWVWLGIAAALLFAYAAAALGQGKLRLSRLFLAPLYLVFALAAAAAGTGIAYLLAKAFNLPFELMNLVGLPYADYIIAALTVVLFVLLVLFMRGRMKKGMTYEEAVIPAIMLTVVLAAVFTILMPGGAFLFSIGAIFACIFGLLALSARFFGLLTGFLSVWIAAPVVALLYVSLTPGAMGVVLLFAAFPMLIAAPSLALALQKKNAKR